MNFLKKLLLVAHSRPELKNVIQSFKKWGIDLVKRNNLRFKKTNRGQRKKQRVENEIASAHRFPIVSNRRKRRLLKEKQKNG